MKLSIERDRLVGKEYTRESVTPHEGAYLIELVEKFQPEMTVEIGSWIGVSTIYLSSALQELGPGHLMVTIDPHELTILHKRQKVVDTEAILRENLLNFGVQETVHVTRLPSLQALRSWEGIPIDLLFLDGSHWFKDVRADFAGWSPYIPSEGLVVFHDYPDRAGVRRVVDDIVRTSGLWDEVGQVKRVIAFQRRRE